MLEGEPNAPKFIYIAYVANIPQMKFVLQKPCLQCMIWLKIMVRPPQHIVLVPKGSPNENFLKKFDARGWTKRSEVYVYSENHTKWSLKPCLQCMKWLNIMIRPPQPIVLVPKVSLIEKLKKNFDTRGWTKRAEVYLYSLCSEHPTKWSLCFKNRACNAWYDSKSCSDPLCSLFWSQRVHQMKNFKKIWC